jgi:phytanoyl-CoA hydroxylase
MSLLSAAQLDFYRTHGYLPLPELFSSQSVAALRDRLTEWCARWNSLAYRPRLEQEPGVPLPGAETVRKLSNLARDDASFYAHARSGVLLDMVEQLLGVPLALYSDEALLKPPLHGSEKPEHQDQDYLQVDPQDAAVSCWTALDDADLENGCLHFYPGTHLGGLLAHHPTNDAPRRIAGLLDRTRSVAVPIAAGGCILYHPLVVHWSPANHSSRWRRAFVCRYVRSDAVLGGRVPNGPPLLEVRN